MKQLDQHGLNRVSGGVAHFYWESHPDEWNKMMREYRERGGVNPATLL